VTVIRGKPQEPAPYIPTAVLEWLEKQFPERMPRMDSTDREIWANVGAHQVLQRVRRVVAEQSESVPYTATERHV
jgi:hypothetical protein